MANTITYDPSDDPQAAAEREATDSESIKVAEEMIKEEQELLAGKYKNAEELERAYIELQKKLGEDTPTEETSTQTEGELKAYNDDGSVDYDTVEQLYGGQITDVLEEAGVDPFVMSQHFTENNGTLTPEMTKQLTDAGFAPDVVDAYLEGMRGQFGFTNQAQSAELTNAEVSEIQNLAGGKAQYDNLTAWASDNLPQEDLDAFDDVVNTGSKSAIRFAVKALNAQYEDAEGRTPTLVTGKTSARGDRYRSMAEVVRDMGDPRYEQDDAYRFDIQQKLERSNLQV